MSLKVVCRMADQYCLLVDRLTVVPDGVRIIDNVSVTFRAGTVTVVVGPNGAGKTTLFNAICGFAQPSTGEVRLGTNRLTGRAPYQIARLGVGRLFQTPRVFGTLSLLANTQVACLQGMAESWVASLVWPLIGAGRERAAHREAMRCLELVGLPHNLDCTAGELSFGHQKLLAFAGLIGSRAKCLLLDEPTAGLSADAANRLLESARSVARNGGTVVVIEHNRDAIAPFCDEMLLMEDGHIIARDVGSAAVTRARVVGTEMSR